ncbi:U2 snRNP component prp10, partial [Coemansia aciculifera]
MSDNLKAQLEAERRKRRELQSEPNTELYSTHDKFAGYDTVLDNTRTEEEAPPAQPAGGRFGITAPRELIDELNSTSTEEDGGIDPFKAMGGASRVIADRESDYQKQRHGRQLSPSRMEADGSGVSYSEAMRKNQLDREKAELLAKISKKAQEESSAPSKQETGRPKRQWDVETPVHPSSSSSSSAVAPVKRNRWDQTPADVGAVAATPRRSRWDETPKAA